MVLQKQDSKPNTHPKNEKCLQDSLSDGEDGSRELQAMQFVCERQHQLLNVIEDCLHELNQNDAQLDILAETANFLKKRHSEIKENIKRMRENEKAMALLSSELEKVRHQVSIWINEVREVREARNDIEIRIETAHNEAKRCELCGKIADQRLEKIQKRHEKNWLEFIHECSPTHHVHHISGAQTARI